MPASSREGKRNLMSAVFFFVPLQPLVAAPVPRSAYRNITLSAM